MERPHAYLDSTLYLNASDAWSADSKKPRAIALSGITCGEKSHFAPKL